MIYTHSYIHTYISRLAYPVLAVGDLLGAELMATLTL